MSPYAIRIPLLFVTGVLAACASQSVETPTTPTHLVQRGDLRITVREQGELQAAVHTRVASQVQGLARLIYLVPEGSLVSQGDRLAELDVSEAEERLSNQAIAVAKAEAALEQQRKNFEIVENMLTANRGAAESALTIAQVRLERFVPQSTRERPEGLVAGTHGEVVSRLRELVDIEAERNPEAEYRYADLVEVLVQVVGSGEDLGTETGELGNRVLQQIDKAALARDMLEIAEDSLANGRQLHEAGRIDVDELDRRRIAYGSQLAEFRSAWNDLELLVRFDLLEEKIRLSQDVSNARLRLESTLAQNEARRIEERARLASQEAEFELAMERLDHWRQQIENAVILAPTPGLVVYARQGSTRGRDPAHVGMEVYERQQLINLPDVTQMIADFKVRESQLDLLSLSQAATIRVDARPNRIFTGTVSRISSLPDSGSRFTNSNMKVYKASVLLDEENLDGALRPGMNASVEIMVGIIQNCLTVPMTAVQRRDDVSYVWKVGPAGPVAVPVRLGSNNLAFVEVVSGLEEGDQVYLETPPGAEVADDLGR